MEITGLNVCFVAAHSIACSIIFEWLACSAKLSVLVLGTYKITAI